MSWRIVVPSGVRPGSRPRAVLLRSILCGFLGASSAWARQSGPGPAAPLCAGAYADDLSVLAPRVREFERDPKNRYSYCLRTTASYECLSYGSDGAIRRNRMNVTAHGTGFAYRRSGGETYVLTNEHVSSWPMVTDDEHAVDGVPVGCKRVSEAMRIVDNEHDAHEQDDITLTPVVVDPALDAAVLKTKAPLKLLPYRFGRSSALRVGNIVAVHGFPLGAFAATNLGKVVNAYDHDTVRDWDHVDFVTDALLSPGNSGSPVLAVSCRTGEYELMGMYHAGYSGGSALNVVVGIDELAELMTTLKRKPRPSDAVSEKLGPRERAGALANLALPAFLPYFPLGSLVAAVRLLPGGTLWYEVYSHGFPLSDDRLLLIEDLPSKSGFGELGRVLVGNKRGLRPLDRQALDTDEQAHLGRILTRLRFGMLATVRYRMGMGVSLKGKKSKALERQRERQATLDSDAAQMVMELSERLGPKADEEAIAVPKALSAAGLTAAASPNPP